MTDWAVGGQREVLFFLLGSKVGNIFLSEI